MIEQSSVREIEPQPHQLTQAFSTTGLVATPIEEIIRIAQKAGADIDLSLNQSIYSGVKRMGIEEWGDYVRSLTAKTGVRIRSAHTGIQFNWGGFAPKALRLHPPSLKEQMLMAKTLGVPLTLHPWDKGRSLEYGVTQEEFINLIETTRANVSLELILWQPVTEPTKDFYGRGEKRRKNPGTATRRQILDFLAVIEKKRPDLLPQFGVTFDVGYVVRRPTRSSGDAAVYISRVYEGIQNIGKKHGIESLIKVIHLYDASGWSEKAKGGLQTCKSRTLPLGKGEISVGDFIRLLKERNFSGVLVHERMPQYLGEEGLYLIMAAVRMGIYEISELGPEMGEKIARWVISHRPLELPSARVVEALKRELKFVDDA